MKPDGARPERSSDPAPDGTAAHPANARWCGGRRGEPVAAGVWHSRQLYDADLADTPGRHFTNYDH